MSDHGAMTLQEEQRQTIFARNGGLEGDIDHDEASFAYFMSELACMTQPQYPLTFWSRSGQSQGQGQVSDLA